MGRHGLALMLGTVMGLALQLQQPWLWPANRYLALMGLAGLLVCAGVSGLLRARGAAHTGALWARLLVGIFLLAGVLTGAGPRSPGH